MNLADKFSFVVSTVTPEIFYMTKGEGDFWICTSRTDKGIGARWERVNIEGQFNKGIWINYTPEKPEMKFPFTFTTASNNMTVYKATRKDDNTVEVSWEGGDGFQKGSTAYGINYVEAYIKNGGWIVKSVGEKSSDSVNESDDVNVDVDTDTIDQCIIKMKLLSSAANKARVAIEQLQKLIKQMEKATS